MKKYFHILCTLILALFLSSCGYFSSTVRNSAGNDKKEVDAQMGNESFLFRNFPQKIKIPRDVVIPVRQDVKEAWYKYPFSQLDSLNSVTVSSLGYRVQIKMTYSATEAEKLQQEITVKTNERAVYVVHEPPMYKVRVGDFIDYSAAKQKSLQLTQIGYHTALIVSDTVLIRKFKK